MLIHSFVISLSSEQHCLFFSHTQVSGYNMKDAFYTAQTDQLSRFLPISYSNIPYEPKIKDN